MDIALTNLLFFMAPLGIGALLLQGALKVIDILAGQLI